MELLQTINLIHLFGLSDWTDLNTNIHVYLFYVDFLCYYLNTYLYIYIYIYTIHIYITYLYINIYYVYIISEAPSKRYAGNIYFLNIFILPCFLSTYCCLVWGEARSSAV